ncbi:hypothetical protein RJ640_029951 [Escallonia rubra]|uniref:MLO-like protein n=1 Tax=Escallonia rubra TaxID=112253 RepID=A0AA88RV09_9ASTE|nr:hypothetical protein RJ640_029951 [Escallonia rubra]
MAGGDVGAAATTLEQTPTWVVAAVCTVIVAISLAVERILHFAGKVDWLGYDAELMLLGFISLLLTVFQTEITTRICITQRQADSWLPCKDKPYGDTDDEESSSTSAATTAHFQSFFSSVLPVNGRRLLAEPAASSNASDYCAALDKIPALSYTAVHHLHIFIFVLAVVHVVFCALTIIFGSAQIRRWKRWEDDVQKKEYNPQEDLQTEPTVTYLGDHAFIRSRFRGIGKSSYLLGWLHSFFKQFYASLTRSDYVALRHGFIMTHCKGNRKFNFHNYMMRALEVDFKRVVGISWYLWMFVVGFLLLNVYGWHAYFYLAFVPFVLLLAVGTKLEHVISQLAHEVAEKHAAIEGDLVVTPSDEHFWLNRPRLVLILIHIILFQNSFEIAFFFFIWIQYGFDSCIMGQIGYIIPRLIVGAFIQIFCSYSTLPLYAIVTQMGSTFKKAIFEEHIQEGLVGWAQKARDRGLRKPAANGSSQVGPKESSQSHHVLQMTEIVGGEEEKEEAALKESNGGGGEIEPAHRIN